MLSVLCLIVGQLGMLELERNGESFCYLDTWLAIEYLCHLTLIATISFLSPQMWPASWWSPEHAHLGTTRHLKLCAEGAPSSLAFVQRGPPSHSVRLR